MLRVLTQWQISEKALMAGAFWLLSAVVLPSKEASFDFRHFIPEESLTISFSRSAPPMAALEDEHLPIVTAKPVTPHFPVVAKNIAKRVPAKHKVAISRLRKARHLAARKSHFSELRKLVEAIPAETPRKTKLDVSKSLAVLSLNRQFNQKQKSIYIKPTTVRDRVEVPLTAPSVPRGLPTGEDAPPTIIESDKVSKANGQKIGPRIAPAFDVVIPKVGTEVETKNNKTADKETIFSGPIQGKGVSNNDYVWNSGPRSPASVAGATPINPKSSLPSTNKPVSRYQAPTSPSDSIGIESLAKREILAADGGHSESPALHVNSQDIFQIAGQVQLTGGLAMTATNKLSIQWKTGSQVRDGSVDYSTGNYLIPVPTLSGGKILAFLKDEKGRVLGRGEYDLDDTRLDPGQLKIENADISIDAQQTLVKGTVLSAYSVGDLVVPVKGAEVFGPASNRDVVDSKGAYRFSNLNSDSTMLVDAYATDHWGTRVIAAGSLKPKLPLFSDRMLQSFLEILGQNKDNSEFGIVWGEVQHKGKAVPGAQVGISTTGAIGPFYFNELRIPDSKLSGTSSNGLFAFVKVKPGLHVVAVEYNKRELPSSVVSVSASMVSYTKISLKGLTLQGRIFDPLAQTGVSGQISVVGASNSVRAAPSGFQLKVPSSDQVVFVEANAGQAYMISREAIPRHEAGNLNLSVYRKDWIADQIKKADVRQDSKKGIFIGYVNGPSFHVQIDDLDIQTRSSNDVDSQVVYFDSNGNPDSSLLDGATNGGAFIIPNIAPGLHTLVITSAEGDMTASRLFVSEAGILNVLSMPLRP